MRRRWTTASRSITSPATTPGTSSWRGTCGGTSPSAAWTSSTGRGNKRNDGLGRPDVTQGVLGETVRNAYLLTDSFRPVDSAHAQRYAGKAAMEAARAAQQQVGLTDDDKNMIVWLHGFLQRPDCPRNVRTAVIAMNQEVTDRQAGRLMNRIFGDVDDVKGAQGWKTDVMRRTLAVRYGVQFAPGDEE